MRDEFSVERYLHERARLLQEFAAFDKDDFGPNHPDFSVERNKASKRGAAGKRRAQYAKDHAERLEVAMRVAYGDDFEASPAAAIF